MVANKNKVPVKMWRKWSGEGKRVFNEVYEFIRNNRENMMHPDCIKMEMEHWYTIAWNAAWVAASAVDGRVPEEVVTG